MIFNVRILIGLVLVGLLLSVPFGLSSAWQGVVTRMLIAALPLLTGTSPSTREREPVTQSAQATGQDRLQRAIELENKLRGAFGMPLRADE